MSRPGGSADTPSQWDDDIMPGLFDDLMDYGDIATGKDFESRLEDMEGMPVLSSDKDEPEFDDKMLKPYWTRFPDKKLYLEQVVFDKRRDIHEMPEVDNLLRSAFPLSAESNVPMGGMPAWVGEFLNFTSIEITRVQNHNMVKLQNMFAQLHNLGEPIRLFHGTNAAAARHIAKGGPTPGVGSRDLWGKGFYMAKKFAYATMYALPDLTEDGTQTVLVFDFQVGNSIVGREGLVNFGETMEGETIHTATDDQVPPELYCGSHSCQFSVTHIITLKLDPFTPLSNLHYQTMFKCGGSYQHALKVLATARVVPPAFSIKPPAAAASAVPAVAALAVPAAAASAVPAVAALAVPAAAALPVASASALLAASIAASAAADAAFLATRNFSVRVSHPVDGIAEGDRVTIIGCARKCHQFTVHKTGEVKMVITLANSPTYFLVNVLGITKKERQEIYTSNKKKCWYDDDDHEWLRCKIKEIKLYVAPAVAAPTTSSGASTSAVQAATSGAASITINTSSGTASSSNGAAASASASAVPRLSVAEVGEKTLGKRPKHTDNNVHKKHKP